jgi:hypothetical protein
MSIRLGLPALLKMAKTPMRAKGGGSSLAITKARRRPIRTP